MTDLTTSFFIDLAALATKYAEAASTVQPATEPAEMSFGAAAAVVEQAPPAQAREQAAPAAAAAPALTHADLMAQAKKIVDGHNGNTNPLIAALAFLGVKKVSDTPAERLGELLAEIKRQYGVA